MKILEWLFGKKESPEPVIRVGQVYYGETSRYHSLRWAVDENGYKLKIVDHNTATDEYAYDSWALVQRPGSSNQRRWSPLKKNRWINPREPMGLIHEIKLGALRLREEDDGYPTDSSEH